VADRFVAAAKAMQDDGWWWVDTRPRSIKSQILREMIAHAWRRRRVPTAPTRTPT